MRPTRDAKQRIKRMSRKIKDLRERSQELQSQHRTLAIQHHVMMCCCELLDWMRSSSDMHPGWMDYQAGLLPEELHLLEQLGPNPIHADAPRHPKQQQQKPRQAAAGTEQQQAASAGGPLQQLLPKQPQPQHEQPAGKSPAQQGNFPPMPAHKASSCSSGTARVLRDAAAAAAAEDDGDDGDPAAADHEHEDGLGPDADADAVANLSLEAFFDGAQDWELSQGSSSTPGPSTACAHTAAAAKDRVNPGSCAAPAHAPCHEHAGTQAPAPAHTSAPASAAAGSGYDRSMMYVSAPGDFLGPLRDAFSQPPYPGADRISVHDLGLLYCDLVDVNREMLGLLERMQNGEQVAHEGPHPVATIKARLATHVSLIATVMLLHPDDVLNKFRLLNHSTMQLEEGCTDKVWDRMWAIVDDLGFTEQQQYLISVGCDVFKRLISGVMQERQGLAARQAELLKVDNGRSIDIQQQQACADRLHLAVKKERFLSQCLGMYVTSVCSVVQVAKLSVQYWPFSPQIAVMGAVLGTVHHR